MSDERIDKLEQSLLALRKRVNQQSREQQAGEGRLRHALIACAVAGAMVALTATTWQVEDSDVLEAADVRTLWGMLPDSWPPVITLALVLALGLGTIGVSLSDDTGRLAHQVLVVGALLAAVMVLSAGTAVVPTFGLDADDYESGPGRWLTLLCALGLAGLHGTRASELR
jgi:hypothetical protein